MRDFVTSNTAMLECILALPADCPPEEIAWPLDFRAVPPLPGISNGSGGYSEIRESTRMLLPAAIYLALSDGDPARAWRIGEGWLLLSRAFKAASFSYVSGGLGVALDGMTIRVLTALQQTAPPDRETAVRLAALLDPVRMERDLLRAFVADTITQLEFFRHFTEERVPLPVVDWGWHYGKTMDKM